MKTDSNKALEAKYGTVDLKAIAQAYFDERFPRGDNGLHRKRHPISSDITALEMVFTDIQRAALTPTEQRCDVALNTCQPYDPYKTGRPGCLTHNGGILADTTMPFAGASGIDEMWVNTDTTTAAEPEQHEHKFPEVNAAVKHIWRSQCACGVFRDTVEKPCICGYADNGKVHWVGDKGCQLAKPPATEDVEKTDA